MKPQQSCNSGYMWPRTITRAPSNTLLKKSEKKKKRKKEQHDIILKMGVPGTFLDLLWVPGCSRDGLKVFWNPSESQICVVWQECCRMLHCSQCRVVGRELHRASLLVVSFMMRLVVSYDDGRPYTSSCSQRTYFAPSFYQPLTLWGSSGHFMVLAKTWLEAKG